jgi:hypothetical protein
VPESNSPNDPQDKQAASAEVCMTCQEPGDPVRIERRGEVVLCAACLGSQLHRRLPWRRYTGLVWIGLLMVPFLTLVVGVGADAADGLRTGSVPAATTLRETLEHGWELLTTVTDIWASLGVITAIAIALPISLGTIASHGEQVARRAETEPVPSLDDYARLTLLDGALTVSAGIALLTAVLAFILGIDAVMDGRTGWAQQALFCLIIAAVLVIEVGKLDAFPKFADRSRLLVKTNLARSVAGRRTRARRVGAGEGARALVVVLALHVAGYLAVAWPAGPATLGKSLTVAVAGLISIAILACLASRYLGAGDRPTAVLTVLVSLLIGAFWVSILYSVADRMQTYPVNPWGVTVGAWLFAPLYLFVALGLIGVGPVTWLAYYSLRIDDALTVLDRAIRSRTSERLGLDQTAREDHEPPDRPAPRTTGDLHSASAPGQADTQHRDHIVDTAIETSDQDLDDVSATAPAGTEASDGVVEPQEHGREHRPPPSDQSLV